MITDLGLVQIFHIGTSPPTDENAHRKVWIVLSSALSPTSDIRYFDGVQWVTIFGKSAYQIWKDLGNTGDEDAFIEAIKGATGDTGPAGAAGAEGKSAYQVWLDLGNTGDENDFIEAITGANGTNGQDGLNGDSAYEVWLALGNTGSEQTFLDSLQGDKGDKGEDGVDGKDGVDGNDGADGVGVPNGGTTGQCLKKNSDTDFDTSWQDCSCQGGNQLVYKTSYTATIDDENGAFISINHNLGTADVFLTALKNADSYDYNLQDGAWRVLNTNTILFSSTEVTARSVWRFIVQGF